MRNRSKYGDAPEFTYVVDKGRQAALVMLREAVAPLLDNNVLIHFTDHSVFHSDNLVHIVLELIEPLQTGDHPFNDQELTILYAACYLHDIGMHNELAGDTTVVQTAIVANGYGQLWQELQPQTKAELIRAHHHQIAAEMISKSVRAEAPMVGLQLTDVYDPGRVAAVCEAHGANFGSDRYVELTKDGPGIRMRLLAGLLRVADILDETRPRAMRAKARILNLGLESQVHWWRHYYTESVTLDPEHRIIMLWFDFPRDRLVEYSRIVPFLQKPWIEAELLNQASVFGEFGLNWALSSTVAAKEYGTAETMPDQVLAAMLKELYRRQYAQAEEQRTAVLEHFIEAQPLMERRLSELNANRGTMPAPDYVHAVSEVAVDMWDFGARRSAWNRLNLAYSQNKGALDPQERMDIGIRLAKMMMLDETADMAARILSDLEPIAKSVDDGAREYSYWELTAQCYFENCDSRTPDVIETAMKYAPDTSAKETLVSWLAEWHFLQTDLSSSMESVEKEGEAE